MPKAARATSTVSHHGRSGARNQYGRMMRRAKRPRTSMVYTPGRPAPGDGRATRLAQPRPAHLFRRHAGERRNVAGRPSAADGYHGFPGGPAPPELELVPFALAVRRRLAECRQIVVACPGAERIAQPDRVIEREAGVEVAGGGEPDPVAGGAEMFRHGRDDPEALAGHREVAGRAARPGGVVRIGGHRRAQRLADPVADL